MGRRESTIARPEEVELIVTPSGPLSTMRTATRDGEGDRLLGVTLVGATGPSSFFTAEDDEETDGEEEG